MNNYQANPHAHTPRNTRFDITIAGEINLDLILYGLPRDLPVERELLASDFQVTLGGSSAILAHNIASIGTTVGFITCVGDDSLANWLSIAFWRVARTSPVLFIPLQAPVSPYFYLTVRFVAFSLFPARWLNSLVPILISNIWPPVVIFTFLHSSSRLDFTPGYQPFSQDSNPGVLPYLSIPTTIPLTNGEKFSIRFCRLSIFFCRMRMSFFGLRKSLLLRKLLLKLGALVPLLVVKRGPRGALVYERGTITEVAPLIVTTVDTIGAGDSFNAGFLAGYLQGKPYVLCAAAGNVTGLCRHNALAARRHFEIRNFVIHSCASFRNAYLESKAPRNSTESSQMPVISFYYCIVDLLTTYGSLYE